MHRVAEAGLLPLAPVGSAVIAAGPKAVAGLLLGVDGAPVVEPRGFSRVAAAFSSYDGDLSLPLGLALGRSEERRVGKECYS